MCGGRVTRSFRSSIYIFYFMHIHTMRFRRQRITLEGDVYSSIHYTKWGEGDRNALGQFSGNILNKYIFSFHFIYLPWSEKWTLDVICIKLSFLFPYVKGMLIRNVCFEECHALQVSRIKTQSTLSSNLVPRLNTTLFFMKSIAS